MSKRILFIVAPMALLIGVLLFQFDGMPVQARMGPAAQQPLEQLSDDSFDQAFLVQMTMHHAMGVVMARPLVGNAAHQEAVDLANSIIADQTREIGQMRTWAQEWYGVTIPDPLAMMDVMMPSGQSGSMPAGMDHSGHSMPGAHGMPGGMMPGGQGMPGGMMPGGRGMPADMMGQMSMMADLWKLPPNRREALFLSTMIPHHQGALDMAALVPGRAAHQELNDLAQAIIQRQSSEIATMNAWLAAWYSL
jgi:uncharacterized protein (DUF305 family)